jgi:uncharacterized membrane protein
VEILGLLFVLFVLVTFFMPWVNHGRIGALKSEIEDLRLKIYKLEKIIFQLAKKTSNQEAAKEENTPSLGTSPELDSTPINDVKAIEEPAVTQPLRASVPESYYWTDYSRERKNAPLENTNDTKYKSGENQKEATSLEQNLATKLPVWIGAVCLIFAAFFLVKYSIDSGLLSPGVRLVLGAVFGCVLVYLGGWIAKKTNISNNVRISQGLFGAGLVSLYFCLYAAVNLYGFLPPLMGFLGMAIVTGVAVVLSLKHGQPIAVFGMLGGLLTPVLVGSDEPNTLILFTYLILLFAGLFYVFAKNNWWNLSIVAVIGMFLWSVLWLITNFIAADSFIIVLFSVAITAIVLSFTSKYVMEDQESSSISVHILNIVSVACCVLVLLLLGTQIRLGQFDWFMMGLLSIAVMALSYFQPKKYGAALFTKMAVTMILFYFWADFGTASRLVPLSDVLFVLGMFIAIYVAGSTFIIRWLRDSRLWVAFQLISAVSLFGISYLSIDMSSAIAGSLDFFWGLSALIFSSLCVFQAMQFRKREDLEHETQDHLISFCALGASAFITIGFSIMLPWDYLPLAIAAQIAATAFVFKETQFNYLKVVMLILTLFFAGINYEQILLFFSLSLNSIFAGLEPTNSILSYVADLYLVKLGLPAILIGTAFWIVNSFEQDKKLLMTLFSVSALLGLGTIYYFIRDVFTAGEVNNFLKPSGFFERGFITGVFALLSIGALKLYEKIPFNYVKIWALALFWLAISRYVFFDFLVYNPYWERAQGIGSLALLNGITITYGGAALLAAWAVFNHGLLGISGYFKIFIKSFGFVSLFALVTFSVRHFFHGENIYQMSNVASAELYAYSVAWLLTGIVLLALGIRTSNKSVRMASLGFITITVLKVFLVDAAELEGLLRIISFFGLGLSLIGLSVFYTKFILQKNRQ